MQDATRDAAAQILGGRGEQGAWVEKSYARVVVPKPASSMRREVGFNNPDSQVLSQRF